MARPRFHNLVKNFPSVAVERARPLRILPNSQVLPETCEIAPRPTRWREMVTATAAHETGPSRETTNDPHTDHRNPRPPVVAPHPGGRESDRHRRDDCTGPAGEG